MVVFLKSHLGFLSKIFFVILFFFFLSPVNAVFTMDEELKPFILEFVEYDDKLISVLKSEIKKDEVQYFEGGSNIFESVFVFIIPGKNIDSLDATMHIYNWDKKDGFFEKVNEGWGYKFFTEGRFGIKVKSNSDNNFRMVLIKTKIDEPLPSIFE